MKMEGKKREGKMGGSWQWWWKEREKKSKVDEIKGN